MPATHSSAELQPANRWLYRRLAIGSSWLVIATVLFLTIHRLVLRLVRYLGDAAGVPAFWLPSSLWVLAIGLALASIALLAFPRTRREALLLGFPYAAITASLAGDPFFGLNAWVGWSVLAAKGQDPYQLAFSAVLPSTPVDYIALVAFFLPVLIWPALVWSWAFRAPKDQEFGTAHYLDHEQVREAGLLEPDGLLLAQWPLEPSERWRLVALRFFALLDAYEPRTESDGFPDAWPDAFNPIRWIDPSTLPRLLEPAQPTRQELAQLFFLQVLAAARLYDAEQQEATVLKGWCSRWLPGSERMRLVTRMRYEIRDDSETHLLVYAPSGSGKSTACAIPLLLDWPGSVVVLDRKFELFPITAGWREKGLGQKVYLLNPTSDRSHSYNPCHKLLDARGTIYEDREAQRLAKLIVDPHGETRAGNNVEDHFATTAEDAMAAVLLHLAYAHPERCTFGGALRLVTDPERPFFECLEEMQRYPHGKHTGKTWSHRSSPDGTPVHPGVAARARSVLDKAGNEASSLQSTVVRHLQAWRDGLISGATHTCDFTPNDLVNGERPGSLYLSIPPSDAERTNALIRLMLGSILDSMIGPMSYDAENARSVSPHRHPLLFVLDEFPTLGYWPKFAKNFLPLFRSYGIRCVFLVQGLGQIKAAYGQHEPIESACGVKVAYRPQDLETAEALSRTLGQRTLHAQRESGRADHTDLLLEQRQINEAVHGRPLETADELMNLPEEAAIVLAHGRRLRTQQLRYHKDPLYASRGGWKHTEVPLTDTETASEAIPKEQFALLPKKKAAAKNETSKDAPTELSLPLKTSPATPDPTSDAEQKELGY